MTRRIVNVITRINTNFTNISNYITNHRNNSNVAGALPLGVYKDSSEFLSGAVAQVAFTYKRLGGDVLDIELTEENVYANFEDAVLEYSYIVNIHQSKNILGSALGGTTGSFDHKGEITSGPLTNHTIKISKA